MDLAVWCFFKEWMVDPTCATIRVTDEHINESIRLDAIAYHWQSRWQIKDTFHADTSPEGLEMADDVCLKAIESYQNPLYPDKPNWTMHLAPKEHAITNINSELHRRGVQAQGTVTDPEAAQTLLNLASATAICDLSGGAPSGKGAGQGRGQIKGRGKDKGGGKDKTVPKKVNLAVEANTLSARITKFEININDLTAARNCDFDEAVLRDAHAQKVLVDALHARYKALQLNRNADEAEKVALQTTKNDMMQGAFKDAEKNLSQRISAKKVVVAPAAPSIA